MEHDPLNYAGPHLPGRAGRTFTQWMILLLAWVIGLAIWVVYMVFIVIVLLRLL